MKRWKEWSVKIRKELKSRDSKNESVDGWEEVQLGERKAVLYKTRWGIHSLPTTMIHCSFTARQMTHINSPCIGKVPT